MFIFFFFWPVCFINKWNEFKSLILKFVEEILTCHFVMSSIGKAFLQERSSHRFILLKAWIDFRDFWNCLNWNYAVSFLSYTLFTIYVCVHSCIHSFMLPMCCCIASLLKQRTFVNFPSNYPGDTGLFRRIKITVAKGRSEAL